MSRQSDFLSEERKDLLTDQTERRNLSLSFIHAKGPGLPADAKVVGKAVINHGEISGVSMYSYTPCGTPLNSVGSHRSAGE